MIEYSEYKGHPVVTLTIDGVGGRGFTFGLAKAMLILANVEELRAWVAKENDLEMISDVTCPDCGGTWVWAHDMPDMPYKPASCTESARCPACEDAEAELLVRAPLAGIEMLDLNSILQLTAGETAPVAVSTMFAVPHTPAKQNTLVLSAGTMPGQAKRSSQPAQPALLSASETDSAESAGKKLFDTIIATGDTTTYDDGSVETFAQRAISRNGLGMLRDYGLSAGGSERTVGKTKKTETIINWKIGDVSYTVRFRGQYKASVFSTCDVSIPAKVASDRPKAIRTPGTAVVDTERQKVGTVIGLEGEGANQSIIVVGKDGKSMHFCPATTRVYNSPKPKPSQATMFSDKQTAGPKYQGNAGLIEHGQPLTLNCQDNRTPEQIQTDQLKAEENLNHHLPGIDKLSRATNQDEIKRRNDAVEALQKAPITCGPSTPSASELSKRVPSVVWSAEALAKWATAKSTLSEFFGRCEVCGKPIDDDIDANVCEYCQDVVGNKTAAQYKRELADSEMN